jgi:hypothetical protein
MAWTLIGGGDGSRAPRAIFGRPIGKRTQATQREWLEVVIGPEAALAIAIHVGRQAVFVAAHQQTLAVRETGSSDKAVVRLHP